jgi:hypothetical protein
MIGSIWIALPDARTHASGIARVRFPEHSGRYTIVVIVRETRMKLIIVALAASTFCSSFAFGADGTSDCESHAGNLTLAQAGAPSGRGSVTGDPAASSANPRAEPTTGNASKSNPSGSGSSTSGGRDDNRDQGRDKMPESDMTVRPNNRPGR